MNKKSTFKIQDVIKSYPYIRQCTENIISFYNKNGLSPSITLPIKNKPSNPSAPIYYPNGTADDPNARIELNLPQFTHEHCYYQLAHELAHSMLNIKLNSHFTWLNELLAESCALFTMTDLGFKNYLIKSVLPYYKKEATATIKSANDFIKSKNFIYLVNPHFVYQYSRSDVTCADVIYNHLPADCSFWKLLSAFIDIFKNPDAYINPTVSDLLTSNASVFISVNAQKEYDFICKLLC